MADGDNPRNPLEGPRRGGPDWVEAGSHPTARRTRMVIGLALASAVVAVAIHVVAGPSLQHAPHPFPDRHTPSSIMLPSEPLLDHCAARVPRADRVRCFNAADSAPWPPAGTGKIAKRSNPLPGARRARADGCEGRRRLRVPGCRRPAGPAVAPL
jgi:hypothetical protein